MKNVATPLLTLLVAAFSAGPALAADASAAKTRGQVKAELAEARRTGDIAHGEFGHQLKELYPGSYPAKPGAQGKTRQQVKEELQDAVRTTGRMPVHSGS